MKLEIQEGLFKSYQVDIVPYPCFHILSILFVGMCVSSKDPLLLGAKGTNAGASPFVIAIKTLKSTG